MADYIDDDNLWKEDLFATLEVSQDATDVELKKSYLKLAKKYHPDKYMQDNPEKLEAQKIFSKITVAYDTLKDPNKKAHYLDLRRLLSSHLPENNQTQSTSQNAAAQAQSNSAQPTATPNQNVPKQEDFTSSDKLREDQARSFYNNGLEYIKKKKIDKAIDSFKQAIEIKSDIAEFHSQLGLAYKTKSWTGMAQGEFKLAYKYNRNDKIAKANMSPEDLAPTNKKVEEKKGFFGGLFSFGKKK